MAARQTDVEPTREAQRLAGYRTFTETRVLLRWTDVALVGVGTVATIVGVLSVALTGRPTGSGPLASGAGGPGPGAERPRSRPRASRRPVPR